MLQTDQYTFIIIILYCFMTFEESKRRLIMSYYDDDLKAL